MPPPRWTTSAEHAYLELQMPDYIRRQAQRKLHLFWPAMIEGWFQQFPEYTRLGLPNPNINVNVNAGAEAETGLTKEERTALGKAIEGRKSQLRSWFRREIKKVRQGPVGVKAMTPLAAALMKKTRAPGTRVHKAVEIFQKLNKRKIRGVLTQRGFDSLNEATRRGANATEETLEVQEGHVKATRSERMRMRVGVVSELWANASEEEREKVWKEVECEREARRVAQREAEMRARDDQPAKSPKQLQEGIDGLDALFGEAAHLCELEAGWASFTLMGGPTPRLGGALTIKVICAGETAEGNNFRAACPNFKEEIVERFQTFLQQTFPFDVRDALALPAASTMPSTPSDTSESDSEDEERPATPKKPKRVRKPKKKTMASGSSAGGPGAPSSAPPPSSPGPSASSPVSAPPCSPSFFPRDSESPPPPVSAPGSIPVSHVSGNWVFPPGPIPGPASDVLAFSGDAETAAVTDWDALYESGGTFDLGAGFSEGSDDVFNTPGGGGGSLGFWNSADAVAWGKFLGNSATLPSTHAEALPLNVPAASPAGALVPAHFDTPFLPPPLPAFPSSPPSLALSLPPTQRPAARPSYKGAAFYDPDATARSTGGSIYQPSVLFRAFDGSTRTPSQAFPIGSPASLRRKASAWGSPAHTPPLTFGGSQGTAEGFASHTARAMAHIVGAPVPSPSQKPEAHKNAAAKAAPAGAQNDKEDRNALILPQSRPAALPPPPPKARKGAKTAPAGAQSDKEDTDALILPQSRPAARPPPPPKVRKGAKSPQNDDGNDGPVLPQSRPVARKPAAPKEKKHVGAVAPKRKEVEEPQTEGVASHSEVAKKPRGRPPKPKVPVAATTDVGAGSASAGAGSANAGVGVALGDTTNTPAAAADSEAGTGRIRKAKKMYDGTFAPLVAKRPAADQAGPSKPVKKARMKA